jgi:hypothetical protein
MNLRREVLACIRACEHLLSLDSKLTDDERSLLEYYVNELSRELLTDKPVVQPPYNGSVPVEGYKSDSALNRSSPPYPAE